MDDHLRRGERAIGMNLVDQLADGEREGRRAVRCRGAERHDERLPAQTP